MIDKDPLYGFSEARAFPNRDDLVGAESGHVRYCPEGVPVEFALLSNFGSFWGGFWDSL